MILSQITSRAWKTSQITSKASKQAVTRHCPRRPQIHSKPRRDPKTFPRHAKITPRRFQDFPKTFPRFPRLFPRLSKTWESKDFPRLFPRLSETFPRLFQDFSKTFPRLFQDFPRLSKTRRCLGGAAPGPASLRTVQTGHGGTHQLGKWHAFLS